MFQNPGYNGPFPTNVSAYFRRPSKVVKPSSRNNSPRNSSRRSTMTTNKNYPTRTRSVVDYHRASVPQVSQYPLTNNRPLSWHPNTMEEMAYLQAMPHQFNESEMASPYTTIEMDALVTPMSFPVMDEPQIQELISPLEDLSADDAVNAYGQGQDFSMETWLNQQQMKSLPNFGANMYPDVAYPTWYNFDQYAIPGSVPNVSISPDYMSMPQLDASLPHHVAESDTGNDDLVGMGLYDSPADVQTSSLLFGNGFGAVARKTLKLEDAFEPAPPSDEDDEDDDDHDDEEDAPNEPDDEFPAPPERLASNMSAENGTHNVMSYPPETDMDLMKLQQWTMSHAESNTWV